MDTKTFTARIAKALNCDQAEAANLVGAFATVLCERASNLDSIAIPAFGNFVALKLPERVVTDGDKRTLVPPQIKMEFVASAMLKKQVFD